MKCLCDYCIGNVVAAGTVDIDGVATNAVAPSNTNHIQPSNIQPQSGRIEKFLTKGSVRVFEVCQAGNGDGFNTKVSKDMGRESWL